MKSSVAAPLNTAARALHPAGAFRWGALAACAAALAGCAGQTAQVPGPGRPAPGRHFDPLLGVWASPRMVDDGGAVPRGGGGFLIGRPYTIGGHLYVPNADPRGYAAAGTASWYGDAFHGRRTANGEIFDKGSISAAHPTLPLPSYVRVTNLNNGRSMIVRVNDRGPYHGGRVMDVSQRVAEALAFRDAGTGRVRIEYVGRAGLAGDDDGRLLATLTTDGRPARLDGPAEPDEAAVPAFALPARVTSQPLFRRGHAIGARAPAATLPLPTVSHADSDGPVDLPRAPRALATQTPPRAPRALAARTMPTSDIAPPVTAHRPDRTAAPHRTAPGRDPFYRPLFPPLKPDLAPRAAISFRTRGPDARGSKPGGGDGRRRPLDDDGARRSE